MLVVVAVKPAGAAAGERALAEHGARVVERRSTGGGPLLLFAAASVVEPVVAALRSAGWAAVARPEAGGHLSAWRANTAPVVVDERLCVCFPWAEFDRASAPPAVEIDPGRAFGTGAHPSTRLLLAELARRVRPGDTVLDVGCGSGVLAVAAARLGARPVATDIDPGALAATARNAAWNETEVGLCEALPPGPFDAVVANIGAGALVDLADALVARTAPGGWIGLSGISPAQVSRVGTAYGRPVEERRDGEWSALVVSVA